MNNPVLRKELQEIIKKSENSNLFETTIKLHDQITAIQSLSEKYPHSILLVNEARMDEPATYKYTCYMYAFDLRDVPGLKQMTGGSNDIYPGSVFVSYLIDEFLEEIGLNDAKDKDYVVYLSEGKIKHAGKVYRGKVISKWGYGHLWEHALFEVPSKYGNEVRFFKQLPENKCMDAFKRWAHFVLSK